MIKYNNRYRGAQEYDKFIINILSLSNVIDSFSSMEKSLAMNDFTTLAAIQKSIIEIYNIFTNENGLDEKCYLIAILERES